MPARRAKTTSRDAGKQLEAAKKEAGKQLEAAKKSAQNVHREHRAGRELIQAPGTGSVRVGPARPGVGSRRLPRCVDHPASSRPATP